LVNEGNYTANYASLIVDCYYKLRGENTYIKKDFTPKRMRDFRNNEPKVIAPHLTYYFDIASIHQFDDITTSENTVKSKQFYKLYLFGDGDF
jgi:hypothetical protein